jgi:hypothetical protein
MTHSAGRKRSIGGASRMSLAGWVARLRYRSLGGAVPAAQPPTRYKHFGFPRALSQSPNGPIFSGTRVVVLPATASFFSSFSQAPIPVFQN